MSKRVLVIVDPQNDFVDNFGSLYVKGAEESIKKLVKFIETEGNTIDEIVVSLDSHYKFHVSNKCFWESNSLKIGTLINKDNLDGFKLASEDTALYTKVRYALESIGPVTIWPEHCLLGTWGWSIYDVLSEALHNWTIKKKKGFITIQKGQRSWAEEYSMLTPFTTQGKKSPLEEIPDVTEYLISGVAGDYCVRNTVEDMIKYIPGCAGGLRITMLENCIATINPDEKSYKGYIEKLKDIGVCFKK